MARKKIETATTPLCIEVQGAAHIYIVTFTGTGLVIRLENSRRLYGPVSYDALFHMAVRLDGGR